MRAPIFPVLVLAALALPAPAATIVFQTFQSSLDTGTLAGTSFPVLFSYDASLVNPTGDSFIQLNSFDFTLEGVHFTRSDIFQGGQVIFHNAVLNNVTASFQVVLPPNAPVRNITFGFGGPGVIGYIDLAGNFGNGSFTFVPEASTAAFSCLGVVLGLALARRHRR